MTLIEKLLAVGDKLKRTPRNGVGGDVCRQLDGLMASLDKLRRNIRWPGKPLIQTPGGSLFFSRRPRWWAISFDKKTNLKSHKTFCLLGVLWFRLVFSVPWRLA